MSNDDFDFPVRVLISKEDRIDFVLSGICAFYGITLSELKKRARNPRKTLRKKIAIKILRDIADVRLIDCMFALGGKSESAIWQLYDSISEDLCGITEIKTEYESVRKYLRV